MNGEGATRPWLLEGMALGVLLSGFVTVAVVSGGVDRVLALRTPARPGVSAVVASGGLLKQPVSAPQEAASFAMERPSSDAGFLLTPDFGLVVRALPTVQRPSRLP